MGRLVSTMADGGGDALLIAVLVVEASYPGTAAYVLRAEEPSQQLKEIG